MTIIDHQPERNTLHIDYNDFDHYPYPPPTIQHISDSLADDDFTVDGAPVRVWNMWSMDPR